MMPGDPISRAGDRAFGFFGDVGMATAKIFHLVDRKKDMIIG
jgi:hypothetical protein